MGHYLVPADLKPWVDQIIDSLAHVASANVSNRSCLTDFKPDGMAKVNFLMEMEMKLDIEIDPEDTRLVTIARAMREKHGA